MLTSLYVGCIEAKARGGDRITRVDKKDRRPEKFDTEKIERSLHYIGLDEITAREIAWKVPERDGITTDEIRSIVFEELKKRDPEAAERYLSTKRLVARTDIDAIKGIALLQKETMSRLNLNAGETIEVLLGERKHSLRAEHSQVHKDDVLLHEEDLKTIGAQIGTRIIVQRSL